MSIDEILQQLAGGATLEGPHWTEQVKVLAVKARGSRVEVQAVGLHTRRLWTKLLKAEDFDGAIKIAQAGELARSLSARGFEPVPVNMSELLKAGGGAKCSTLELRERS